MVAIDMFVSDLQRTNKVVWIQNRDSVYVVQESIQSPSALLEVD